MDKSDGSQFEQSASLFLVSFSHIHTQRNTVNPGYNDHPWDPKIVVVVDRWSLLRGHLCYKSSNKDLKMAAVTDR